MTLEYEIGLENEKRRKYLEVIYIIILAASVMGDMNGFSVSATRMMKSISLLIVVIGVGMLCVTGNLNRLKTTARFSGLYGFALMGIIVWSIFLWIINLESVDFIMRGTTKFMYQFLVLSLMFMAVYMFGERAIYTTLYGILLANTAIMLINLSAYGIGESINSVVTMVTGGLGQEGFARSMELNDITFTYGFFIIYLMFFAQHNKERNICIILSIFFFLLGWKRIALAALPVALLFGLILGRMGSKRRRSFMMVVAWTSVILAFLYVVSTKVGWFGKITDMLGIDAMGRNEVYEYIKEYYKISIGFLGYGFEYTTTLLLDVIKSHPEAKIGVVALHNNILTIYIELGFIGFWAWMVYTWVFQLHWMIKHWGEKAGMLFFLCELYIFITYTTDNTLYYFYTSFVFRLIPAAYAFHIPTNQDVKLWPWVRVKDEKI